jgi:hypothetical protein
MSLNWQNANFFLICLGGLVGDRCFVCFNSRSVLCYLAFQTAQRCTLRYCAPSAEAVATSSEPDPHHNAAFQHRSLARQMLPQMPTLLCFCILHTMQVTSPWQHSSKAAKQQSSKAANLKAAKQQTAGRHKPRDAGLVTRDSVLSSIKLFSCQFSVSACSWRAAPFAEARLDLAISHKFVAEAWVRLR